MIEIIQSAEFSKWMQKLRDKKAVTVIADRLLRIEGGNFGDVALVGEGVSEARIHYGPGYRLYFVRRGQLLIVMLAGGDKSSQKRDIKRARELASQWR